MELPKSKAFVYVRKSQDRDDRQVLSIESQLREVAPLVERNDLAPIYMPSEQMTAYKPGRQVFGEMMDRIGKREARRIVCWSVNRLARNALDGGCVINALDQGDLISIITPGRVYRNTSDDKLLLAIEFGMSKKSSDDIKDNVHRGYREKYERGEYPGYAPNGYLNVIQPNHTRNIAPDPVKAPQYKQICEQAVSGTYTLDQLHKYALSLGFTSRRGNPISKQTLHGMLINRLYAGTFFHGGSWRVGTYQPLISVGLFDQVQLGMGFKSRKPATVARTLNHRYKGVLVCGFCGCSITAETKVKKLANGVEAAYTYYRCTRKNKRMDKCLEPAVTEKELEQQLTAQVDRIVISEENAEYCKSILREYHIEQVQNRNTMLPLWRKDGEEAKTKLDRLWEMRLNEEVGKDEFKQLKQKLQAVVDRTESLISDSSHSAKEWLELAEEFFSNLVMLRETFDIATADERRTMLNYIGSNWVLESKKVVFTPRKPYDLLLKDEPKILWRARPDSNRRSPP